MFAFMDKNLYFYRSNDKLFRLDDKIFHLNDKLFGFHEKKHILGFMGKTYTYTYNVSFKR